MIGDTGQIEVSDVKMAIDFVKLNQESLLALWEQDLDVADIVWQRVS